MSMDMLRFKVLRAFGVAPWSEEAKGLTDEMCLEYAALLDGEEEKHSNSSFEENNFLYARAMENAPMQSESAVGEKSSAARSDMSAMSDYIEREMRCRDNGFIIY